MGPGLPPPLLGVGVGPTTPGSFPRHPWLSGRVGGGPLSVDWFSSEASHTLQTLGRDSRPPPFLGPRGASPCSGSMATVSPAGGVDTISVRSRAISDSHETRARTSSRISFVFPDHSNSGLEGESPPLSCVQRRVPCTGVDGYGKSGGRWRRATSGTLRTPSRVWIPSIAFFQSPNQSPKPHATDSPSLEMKIGFLEKSKQAEMIHRFRGQFPPSNVFVPPASPPCQKRSSGPAWRPCECGTRKSMSGRRPFYVPSRGPPAPSPQSFRLLRGARPGFPFSQIGNQPTTPPLLSIANKCLLQKSLSIYPC